LEKESEIDEVREEEFGIRTCVHCWEEEFFEIDEGAGLDGPYEGAKCAACACLEECAACAGEEVDMKDCTGCGKENKYSCPKCMENHEGWPDCKDSCICSPV
jgi:hypothetical protein